MSQLPPPKGRGLLALTIKIDTEKIPEGVKFYFDPNMPNAMYTTDSIPSDVIVETKRYRFGE